MKLPKKMKEKRCWIPLNGSSFRTFPNFASQKTNLYGLSNTSIDSMEYLKKLPKTVVPKKLLLLLPRPPKKCQPPKQIKQTTSAFIIFHHQQKSTPKNRHLCKAYVLSLVLAGESSSESVRFLQLQVVNERFEKDRRNSSLN